MVILRSARAEDHHHERATSTKGETPPHGSRLIRVLAEGLVRPSPGGAPGSKASMSTHRHHNWTRQRSRNYSPSTRTIPADIGTMDSSDPRCDPCQPPMSSPLGHDPPAVSYTHLTLPTK